MAQVMEQKLAGSPQRLVSLNRYRQQKLQQQKYQFWLQVLQEELYTSLHKLNSLARVTEQPMGRLIFARRVKELLDELPLCERLFPSHEWLPTYASYHHHAEFWGYKQALSAHQEMASLCHALENYLAERH